METNKQKAIREAWIELIGNVSYSRRKDKIDEKGYIQYETPNNLSVRHELCEKHPSRIDWEKWRPKSLQGIETNNNWISILSESDLPTEDCDCHIEFEDGAISIDRYFVFGKNFTSNHWRFIVAYRLIEKPNKRIY